jgi:D-aminopeptidase
LISNQVSKGFEQLGSGERVVRLGGIYAQLPGRPSARSWAAINLRDSEQAYQSGGSIVIIIATDAPLSDRNLRRLARRAFIGVGNTGCNSSGDYALVSPSRPPKRCVARRRAGGRRQPIADAR